MHMYLFPPVTPEPIHQFTWNFVITSLHIYMVHFLSINNNNMAAAILVPAKYIHMEPVKTCT